MLNRFLTIFVLLIQPLHGQVDLHTPTNEPSKCTEETPFVYEPYPGIGYENTVRCSDLAATVVILGAFIAILAVALSNSPCHTSHSH